MTLLLNQYRVWQHINRRINPKFLTVTLDRECWVGHHGVKQYMKHAVCFKIGNDDGKMKVFLFWSDGIWLFPLLFFVNKRKAFDDLHKLLSESTMNLTVTSCNTPGKNPAVFRRPLRAFYFIMDLISLIIHCGMLAFYPLPSWDTIWVDFPVCRFQRSTGFQQLDPSTPEYVLLLLWFFLEDSWPFMKLVPLLREKRGNQLRVRYPLLPHTILYYHWWTVTGVDTHLALWI